MKNWFKYSNIQKTASLTLSVSGFFNKRNLSDMHELAFEFQEKIGDLPALNNFFMADNISPDGDTGFHASTGVMNFYLDPKSSPTDIEGLKVRIMQVAKELNVEGELGQVENWESKIQEEREILRQLQNDPDASHENIEYRSIRITGLPHESAPRVIRLNITKNNNKRDVFPPEVNMANDNAFYIFNTILQYDKDLWEGVSLNAVELKKRCQYFLGETEFKKSNPDKIDIAREKVKDAFNGRGGDLNERADLLSGKHALSTYQDDKVRSQLDRIIKLCDWAIKNGYNQLGIG